MEEGRRIHACGACVNPIFSITHAALCKMSHSSPARAVLRGGSYLPWLPAPTPSFHFCTLRVSLSMAGTGLRRRRDYLSNFKTGGWILFTTWRMAGSFGGMKENGSLSSKQRLLLLPLSVCFAPRATHLHFLPWNSG